MDRQPVVTAVVTTYKRSEKIVGRALESVVKQTYRSLEIILVNDCPEDKELSEKLKKLCESFDRKVVYLPMKKNSGANAARNYGARFAQGSYIAFLDDDDTWTENKISLQVQEMKDPSVGIVYGNTWVNSEKYHSVKIHYRDRRPEGDLYPKLFKSNIIGSTSFPLIRKKAFDDVGGFNEAVPALQDMELWLRIAKTYKVKYIHEPLGTYYFYVGDRISAHPERRVKGYEEIYSQHKKYLAQNEKAKADFDILGVTLYINQRNFKHAFGLLCEAIKLNPLNIKSNSFTLIKFIIRFFIPAKIV